MSDTAEYYAEKISKNAVTINDTQIGMLIADAVEDSDIDLAWDKQGDVHENIQLRIKEEVKLAAKEEIREAINEQ